MRYIAEYMSFLVASLICLALLQVRSRHSLVHVCNLPDLLVFSAVIPKALGSKVILDLRESTPEFYQAKYGIDVDSRLIQALSTLERWSIRFADAVLTCTKQMRTAFVSRGADPDKVFVMLNSADPDIFRSPALPDAAQIRGGTFRIVTHGTITKRYGHSVLLRAMPLVLRRIPGATLEIMGAGEQQIELEQLVKTLGLDDVVTFTGYLPLDDLVRRLRAADCGIVSMPRSSESDLIHTYKMQEYMALGIPVIITRTTAVKAYYPDTCVRFFESENEGDLAEAIVGLYLDPRARYEMAKNALAAYQRYSAPKQREYYVRVVQSLLLGAEQPRQVGAETG